MTPLERIDPVELPIESPDLDCMCSDPDGVCSECWDKIKRLQKRHDALVQFAKAVEKEFTPTHRGLSPQWTHINTGRHLDALDAALSETE